MTTGAAPISVQLYSLRDEAAADFVGVLRRLGEIGFVGVELAGFHGMSTGEFNAVIADAGLAVSSAHIGDVSPDALNAALDDIQAVGCHTAVLAYLPPAVFADAEAIARSAEALNAAAEIARGRGVALGYHNHWWEFQTSFGGRRGWDLLFDRLGGDVFAELDLYWATLGGADVHQVIGELGDRLRLLHVKDGPADDPEAPMVAVGSGRLDIAGILVAAPQARWHVVELDRCETDMFDAVVASHDYLVGAGLSRGRS